MQALPTVSRKSLYTHIAVLLLSFLCGSLAVHAESPKDRLAAAAAHAQLDAPGLQPWHLKLDVTIYDSNGKNPVAGTIERWNADNGSRTVFTFGSNTRTLLNAGDKFYASHTGEVPALADGVLEAVLRPGPSEHDIESFSPELQTESFGKVKLDCVMLAAQSVPRNGPFALGLFPTYCMDVGGQVLRASFNFGSYSVLRNDIQEFQGRYVANSIALVLGHNTHIAEARITALETFTPKPDEFTPDDSLKSAVRSQVRVSGGMMKDVAISKPPPIYPASARQAHIQGTVILHAVIGRDGHLRSLRPISAPSTDLALAAIDAVRQWTYRPYLLNGEPTEVETTVTVNFNLNP